MTFRKLKRVWSHNDMDYIPRFSEAFPELKHVSSEELCDRFSDLNINWYSDEQVTTSIWMRLTLPLALICIIVMFAMLPFIFIITGKWGWRIGKKAIIYNWFASLNLM